MPNPERFSEKNKPTAQALRAWAEKEREATPKPDPEEKAGQRERASSPGSKKAA
ncbi:MAG: hypothetical protein ABIH88_02105 [Patescibacteria group bacterium]|nr:hypothetical protein [Patescibacteria group bacterium]